jgi:NAD+ kinase
VRIGIVGNPSHGRLEGALARLVGKAAELGAELVPDARIGAAMESKRPGLEEVWPEVDCLLTLGGDGTLLQAARQAGPAGVPILGCNLGRLGFLTAGSGDELESVLERLVAGELEEQERLTLQVRLERGAGEHDEPPTGSRESGEGTDADLEEGPFYALNDAVVHKTGFARLISLRVWVDDEQVGQYSADGIVISTATGSTAYSLSAGGPILVPEMDALVATPISPHTLAVRPVVVPASSRITVEVLPRSRETILTVDGQSGVTLAPGDRIVAERSEHPVRLFQIPERSFFRVLRRKLRWGDVRPQDGADEGI